MTTTIKHEPTPTPLAPLTKLDKDVRAAGATIGRDATGTTISKREATELVDLYYRLQKDRISLGNQRRQLDADGRPSTVVAHFATQFETLESQMIGVLQAFAEADAAGRWCLQQLGIGPIISAGLIAHIDITKAPTVGHIWRFAGLDPTVIWAKGQKRPWNADLKLLSWKIGDSFVKVSNRDPGPGRHNYGLFYRERKAWEIARNEQGVYAAQAAASLAGRKINDRALRETLESGRLPLGRIELRARRYATKLFLAHLHETLYKDYYGCDPPAPYVIEHLGHAHQIPANPI